MERPDGSTPTAIGWGLVTLGVVASFFVTFAETPTGWWFSLALANLGIGLGVLLLSLGYLVRAIWFLPGREGGAIPSHKAPQSMSETSDICEWCGVSVQGPAKPCSAFRGDQLPVSAARVHSPVCRAELEKRGHLE